MNQFLNITLSNDEKMQFTAGTNMKEIACEAQKYYKTTIMAVKINNDIKELSYIPENDCNVEFVDLTYEDGMRIYRRSLHFVLIKAVYDLFPDRKVTICHSISKGIYCEIIGNKNLSVDEVAIIEKRMLEIIAAEIPYVKHVIPLEEAKEIFEASGRMDRFHAVQHRNKDLVTMYSCDGLFDYFYGYMAPHTGYAKLFSLKFYDAGLIMFYPDKACPGILPDFKEQKKLFDIFHEYKDWAKIIECNNVGALNNVIKAGHANNLIMISEALQEKKIAQIADMITNGEERKKVVLISGPSSSGKTTFSHRLAVQLRVNGLKPINISLDDYFIDRENTPIDETGDFDFETLDAIDVELFNMHLKSLLDSIEVEIPIYNFHLGKREAVGRKLAIADDNIIIIEGIHGLNDRLSKSIPKEKKFKIYVSALTSLSIDDHNRVPTTDARIIRRMVRDYQFRGVNALSTLKRWPSVRRGEKKNIFPFQEEADVMFNSSLLYELSVLKHLAEPLLKEVDQSNKEYSEARRLAEFLSYFLEIDSGLIPGNSIIREFIGKSVFY